MQVKLTWAVIAVIALGLFGIVMFTFAEDRSNEYEPMQETKNEKSIIETQQEKERKFYSDYIEKDIVEYEQPLYVNFDPAVLEYRYNKYFKDLNIDRSMHFGEVGFNAEEISTNLSDKISIYGSLGSEMNAFTHLSLIGAEITTDKEIEEFKEVALAFFTAVANQKLSVERRKDILYKTMNFEDILKNGGQTEFFIEDIKYNLLQEQQSEGLFIELIVSNNKNN
ncbi:hypothetical protein ABEV54_17435 [Peribacillus psychrosaccharolyticus]|uniref:hypothetical protein n=1 Tax=Peribacillus psychrosaccharolyticus TaxID=1407 RepID=UPI003D27F490